MTAVADARTTLYDALRLELVEFPWRVHRVTPAQVVAPTVWLDAVELGVDTGVGAGIIVATFPIYLVHDGTVRPQVEALDDLLARAWSASATVGSPLSSRPMALDVGGPNLRAHVLRVDVELLAVTLCAVPSLTAIGADS